MGQALPGADARRGVDGTLDMLVLDRAGVVTGLMSIRPDAALHLADAARAGDDSAVLAGWSDAGGGFVARVGDTLAWTWGPVELEVAVVAVAATPAGDAVLLAGDLDGAAFVEGVGDIGQAGHRQVYAVRLAPP